ncbi:hypothetical protein EYY94_15565 [Obesumbacterium proteus]|uniref:antibiotic biosynthesis monooxygenase family protein n=1 Tax=Obesumbacterium proteus TaxID=82983 RepID=UPI001033CE76|nr:hypothetical protein [Obesumbacterium proteus]TBL73766.1 hypothetical protein EYY94_15565 [Obesumbacterium proteus]
MFLTSFIFDKKEYDEDFYKLDKKIEDFSKDIAGFIGMESFTDVQSGRLINNYYWDNREGLELLMNNVEHLRAKEQSGKWIAGFQVVIAKIEGAHNVNLDHPLSEHPMRYRGEK